MGPKQVVSSLRIGFDSDRRSRGGQHLSATGLAFHGFIRSGACGSNRLANTIKHRHSISLCIGFIRSGLFSNRAHDTLTITNNRSRFVGGSFDPTWSPCPLDHRGCQHLTTDESADPNGGPPRAGRLSEAIAASSKQRPLALTRRESHAEPLECG
jgi:hypothetical protein